MRLSKTYFEFCFAIISLFSLNYFLTTFHAQAEILEVRNEEKNFGEWKVFCEIDDMMNLAHCKIATKFYDGSSVLSIQPSNKFANQFFLVIPKIRIGTFVKIRVDQNDLILSKNVSKKDFGMIPIDDKQKNILFSQMKNGKTMFLRFSISDSDKEITNKFKLDEFRDALDYYSLKALNQTSKN